MSSELEVLIPLRNPTETLRKTVDSLAGQTDKFFSVLLCDNASTQGLEQIQQALDTLRAAGITARKIQTPMELGRVDHWNWMHHQSIANWLKPLAASDWLEAGYCAGVKAAIAANPGCHYIFSNYYLHRGDAAPVEKNPTRRGRFFSAAEMQQAVLRSELLFSPPSAAAYTKTAFVSVGSYPTNLPLCADRLFFSTLAFIFGGLELGEPLLHHHLSGDPAAPCRQRYQETVTCLFLLAYYAWTENINVPRISFTRMLLRETCHHWRGSCGWMRSHSA